MTIPPPPAWFPSTFSFCATVDVGIGYLRAQIRAAARRSDAELDRLACQQALGMASDIVTALSEATAREERDGWAR